MLKIFCQRRCWLCDSRSSTRRYIYSRLPSHGKFAQALSALWGKLWCGTRLCCLIFYIVASCNEDQKLSCHLLTSKSKLLCHAVELLFHTSGILNEADITAAWHVCCPHRRYDQQFKHWKLKSGKLKLQKSIWQCFTRTQIAHWQNEIANNSTLYQTLLHYGELNYRCHPLGPCWDIRHDALIPVTHWVYRQRCCQRDAQSTDAL